MKFLARFTYNAPNPLPGTKSLPMFTVAMGEVFRDGGVDRLVYEDETNLVKAGLQLQEVLGSAMSAAVVRMSELEASTATALKERDKAVAERDKFRAAGLATHEQMIAQVKAAESTAAHLAAALQQREEDLRIALAARDNFAKLHKEAKADKMGAEMDFKNAAASHKKVCDELDKIPRWTRKLFGAI